MYGSIFTNFYANGDRTDKGIPAILSGYYTQTTASIIKLPILITALQQVISRQLDPTVPAVLTFGSFIAEGSTNIIPNEVKIKGTFRCMNEKWRMVAHDKMYKMGVGIVEAMGGKCDFNIVRGYPCLYNNEPLTAKIKDFANPSSIMTSSLSILISSVVPSGFLTVR